MKKFIIIIAIVVILVSVTGCNVVRAQFQTNPNGQSLATAAPAAIVPASNSTSESDASTPPAVVPVSDPIPTMVDEVSAEEAWGDLVSYAEQYLSGKWDGGEIYRSDYREGRYAYAKIDEDGWLRVGNNFPVIPGATIPSSSLEALEAFDGWVQPNPYSYEYAWAEDYSVEYTLGSCGEINATGIAPWNRDYFKWQVTVVDAEVYRGDRFDYALLREMLINGSWDGSRIWCPDSGEIIEPYMLEWGVPCGIDNTLRRFLALDEPLEQDMGYCDPDTMLTAAITKDGIGLYALDGSLVGLIGTNCDEREAFVMKVSAGPCFVYDGRENIYIADFESQTLQPAYQDIELWYGQEGLAGVRGIDQLGMEYFVLIWGDRDYSVNGLFE